MKLYGKNTARLAVMAGLCASMAFAGAPTAAIAEELGLEQTAAVDQPAAVEPTDPAETESAEADAAPVDSASEPETAAEQPVAEAPTGYVVVDAENVTINDLDALKYFAQLVNGGETFKGKTVTLGDNIDLNNEEWVTIGTASNPFMGIFNGANKTISNLKITKGFGNTAANSYQGLFGHLNSPAVVKDLTINNVDVSGSLYVGAVAGNAYTGKEISNCHVTGLIQIDAYWYAGVISGNGYLNTVSNCTVQGDKGSYIKGNDGSYIGGIWGYRGEGSMTLRDCSVSGLSISGVDRVGGISGMAQYGNIIEGCAVSDVVIKATDPSATTVGTIVGACQGTAEEPAVIENNTVDQSVAATAGDRVITGTHGTNISGCRPVVKDEFVAYIGEKGYISLDAALKAVEAGQTIKLGEGTFAPFTVPAGVTVEGAGAGKTIIKNSTKSKFLLNGNDITLKNLTVDSSADGYYLAGKETTTPSDNLTLDGVEFLGNGKAGSTAIWIHEPNITINNCTFKDFERGYYTCGDNHAIGEMTFTGNTFTNVKVPLDGYWGKPAADGNKITITGNTFDGGSWGKAHVQLWDYAQYQHWLNGADSQHNPKGETAIDAVVKDNKGDFDLILTHGNWYSSSKLETDHAVVRRTLVEIDGTDVESVVVKNADGTPVTSWNESPDSSNRGNKVVIYSLSEGDYIFEVTHKAKDGADAIVTSQKVTVAAPESNDETPSVEVAPLPENVSVATVVKADGSKITYESLEQAIRAAEKGETIELSQSVKVATWNQIWPDGSPSKLDGITIDGKGHTLTIDKIESKGNGNYMLFQAKNLTVKDITINLPEGGNGFDMETGSLINVTFNGGNKAAYLGGGDITVDGCTFNGVAHALYTEVKTGKAEVKNSTFTGCDYVVIMHKPGSSFVGNTVSGGKLNIMGEDQKVQGNTFEDGSRIKFYADSVEGAFSKNSISQDSTVVFDDRAGKDAHLGGNYWGSPDGPVAGQLPEGTTVESWYEDEDMTQLNTDAEIFKVTFVYGNGVENKVVEVEEGQTVSKPADPTRAGYVFAGWYTTVGEGGVLSDEFDFTSPVTGDLTIYAGWIPEEGDSEDPSKPEDPTTPENPSKPGEKPGDSNDGTTGQGGTSADKPGSGLPQTGDASLIAVAAAGAAGVVSLAGAAARRRKGE